MQPLFRPDIMLIMSAQACSAIHPIHDDPTRSFEGPGFVERAEN